MSRGYRSTFSPPGPNSLGYHEDTIDEPMANRNPQLFVSLPSCLDRLELCVCALWFDGVTS